MYPAVLILWLCVCVALCECEIINYRHILIATAQSHNQLQYRVQSNETGYDKHYIYNKGSLAATIVFSVIMNAGDAV